MTLPVDTVLENRYRIDQLLAHGGMGAIYQAFDTNLNIRVAIKENFLQTPQSINQFQQEALILARLRHPNLPRVIHHFSFEGQQYLVMDFIEGKDLWQIVKRQGHPVEERLALSYIIQVCDAVSYLHRQNPSIIHRDIKPQNIKITPDDRAVLVDFGIAKVGGEDSQTRTGARGVTPGFSPPEQYSGVGTTPISDVYALGATLYAVLTAKKPPDSISLMVGGAKFEPPNTINPNLSRQVSQAIEHAMQVQQADRPQSVAAWQKTLKTVLESPSADKEETLKPGTIATAIDAPYWLVDSAGLGYPISSKPLVIGRHAQADVVIQVLSASREHAYIRFDGQRCLVKDNNSANGTFINNQRLSAGWQPINPGDTLAVGTSRFNITPTRPANVASPKSKLTPVVEDGVTTLPVPPIAPVPPPPPSAPPATPTATPPMQSTLPPSAQQVPQQTFTAPPAAQKRTGMIVLPLIIAAVIILGALGVAAYFLLNSGIFSSPTPTSVILVDPLITATKTTETNGLEAKKTMTAQAEAAAESARQTEQAAATATAEAIAAQTTKAENIPTATPTESPQTATLAKPTATSTKRPPTATRSQTKPTPTPSPEPPTATRRPVAAGPTVIPLKSELSVPQIGTKEVTYVAMNPKNPKEVYVLVKGDGIYKSSNGGDGPWARMILDGSGLTAFVIDPTNPARFFAPTWNAVLRSDDGGNSWRAFGNGLSSANRVVDTVTVDPASPNIVYAGIGDTLVVSTDNGENWTSEGYGNGLQGGRLNAIVVDPSNHDIVFVGGLFGSLYKSFDSGRNFKQLAFNTGEGTFSLVVHPTEKDVYLIGINSYDAGIMKTENGADFRSISHGLVFGGADSAYSAIAFAPSNPNIVYAGSGFEDDRFAKGIFKNTAGGEEKWLTINNGLSVNPATGQPHYVKAIVVHPANPDIVLAATGGGIYKTVDGGANWGQK